MIKTLEELKNIYPNCEKFTHKDLNKTKFPQVFFNPSDIDLFNEIYQYLIKPSDDNIFYKVEPGASGSMPCNNMTRWHQRYTIIEKATSFELCLVTFEGCWRFIFMLGYRDEKNTVSGSKALKEIYRFAEKYGVLHVFQEHTVEKEEGLAIKDAIESSIVAVIKDEYIGEEFTNVHHMDLNSSYASQIVRKYPELRPMYDELYAKRKDNNDYYKHVLTNSIGAMQSPYCLDVNNVGTCFRKPYQLAHFAKVAIDGNNDVIKKLIRMLEFTGRKPLLINTDGIWYQGKKYKDNDEGPKLMQWKHDHQYCDLYIKSPGAYQYRYTNTDGNVIVKSVVRGQPALASVKPDRNTWEWREIDKYPSEVVTYKFEIGKGVVKEWSEM